ncbi:TetR/AcrR family transcriptional regulator [Arthrobacter sp. zg-Y820]|uniref:TetR/AcrR family transcriptional regulator n=1 Tax=unclassified Arthrobacter TaxID=235627 RepID=UPI001E482F7E|nr:MULTISPECIES: TetR/AcrR family transcriptional regulator [unclassified Arthrobacter]MCC9196977.1 TetR/AcrR family transcriptional regulator [Arthrobacter sp. zg-Y820]MDK1279842.1 TetR/AcrR family transcriptional regulator [Arthrobacter sp. zg.Y820]WIB09147.1 TetR/AcrR family transcriptional regulator [Arthrobacter sp. zg-Y820]
MTASSPVRARILEAAASLFYSEGIRAVSADRIIADAGTTKVTFYRHFRTKEDLVVAYLQAQTDRVRAAAEHLSDDPCTGLLQLAEAMGAETCLPGFRGCPFINAAAEYPDANSPVRAVVRDHRQWLHAEVSGRLTRLGAPDPDALADQLLMLRDGAMVHGYVSDPAGVAASLVSAGRALLAAALY